MLIPRLLRFLLNFYAMGVVPEGGGGAAPDTPEPDAPSADNGTPAADEPAAAAPAAAEPNADPFAGLNAALDAVSDGAKPKEGDQPSAAPAPNGATPAAPTPTPAPTAAPAAAKPGEPDLTPPEGMTDRAKARWDELTGRVKAIPELERRATEAESQVANVRKMVANSGMDAGEFSEMLETGRLLKSSDPKDLEAALARIDEVRTDIAMRLGKDVPGADPLAAHPDLKADVDALALTRERALEIARGRNAQKLLQADDDERKGFQTFQETVEKAAKSMDVMLAQRAAEPGHAEKVAFIRQRFSNPQNLQSFVQTYQPHQWNAAIMMMYDAYTPPAAATPAPPQPLRPGNVRPGGRVPSGAVTAMSAVEAAVDGLGL